MVPFMFISSYKNEDTYSFDYVESNFGEKCEISKLRRMYKCLWTIGKKIFHNDHIYDGFALHE